MVDGGCSHERGKGTALSQSPRAKQSKEREREIDCWMGLHERCAGCKDCLQLLPLGKAKQRERERERLGDPKPQGKARAQKRVESGAASWTRRGIHVPLG